MMPRRSSTVEAVICNPLKSLASTVASTVPRRFARCLQAFEIITSTVLDGPLSGNPHTPYSPKGSARALPTGLDAREKRHLRRQRRHANHRPTTELNRQGNTHEFAAGGSEGCKCSRIRRDSRTGRR